MVLVDDVGDVLFFYKWVGGLVKHHGVVIGVFFKESLQLDLLIELGNLGLEFLVLSPQFSNIPPAHNLLPLHGYHRIRLF
jgi:hypothetical protein